MLGIAFRIARRELRGGIGGFRVFLTCLILGVAGIAAIGSVREAIRAGLESEGATLLGGDAEMELTYRFAEPEERAWMDAKALAVSELVEFRSMAVFGSGDAVENGLTEIKAVDESYPIYGKATLEPDIGLAEALDGEDGLPGAVMAPLLVDRLGMEVGDRFRLGVQDFVLMARLESEPDEVGGGFGFGPRTIVRTADLADSGLLQPGTLFETAYRLKLPSNANLDALEAETEAQFAGVRWRDKRNGAPGVERFVDRLSSFLVLVGLAGLAVGGVGISTAVRAYLESKTEVIATLRTLGASRNTIFMTYFMQVGILSVVGLIAGLALGAAVPFAFAPVIESQLPTPVIFSLHLWPLVEAALYGVITALIFTLWPLARVENVRAAALFRQAADESQRVPRPIWIVITVLLLALLVVVAARLSGLWMLTLGAAGGLVGSFLCLAAAAAVARRLSRSAAKSRIARGKTAWRMAFGAVGGPNNETTPVVLSLGLGLTVLAAVGQIDANLRGAIERDLPDVAPSFFMVDIQPGQMGAFAERLNSDAAVSDVQSAPMLRGTITQINGQPAREVAGDHWVLRGDRGVTYSAAPPDGTNITQGVWWPEDYAGPPQLSFATEEAEELGLSLGDEITVNILGRDIVAEIASFREVDFSSAGIGFVMSMNPNALAGAPHSFISTVYADAGAEPQILRDISKTFPNVTSIRVKDAIDRVSEILAGIASAITVGALATLVTGVVVLIGAAAAGTYARTYEAAVLKTLGASRRTVLVSFAIRSALLGAAAGTIAILAGAISAWAVMTFVMDGDFVFEPVSATLIILGGVLATLLAGLGFAWGPLAKRPAQVLRARE